MTSLIFRALDQQVISGNAETLAIDEGTVSLSYAQLLAKTSALAGGLARVGVEEGTPVALALIGVAEVEAVLALARVGAVPDGRAEFRIDGDPPVVHTGEFDYEWSTVLSAGKTDPLPAPASDEPGYAELLLDAYEDVFATLTAGGTLT